MQKKKNTLQYELFLRDEEGKNVHYLQEVYERLNRVPQVPPVSLPQREDKHIGQILTRKATQIRKTTENLLWSQVKQHQSVKRKTQIRHTSQGSLQKTSNKSFSLLGHNWEDCGRSEVLRCTQGLHVADA